jgi:hypothetical protein
MQLQSEYLSIKTIFYHGIVYLFLVVLNNSETFKFCLHFFWSIQEDRTVYRVGQSIVDYFLRAHHHRHWGL